MSIAPPVITTPRLDMREVQDGDLDFLSVLLGDPLVMRFYVAPLSRHESRRWLERQRARYQSDGHGLWLASIKETGEPVGQIGLVMQDVNGERLPEIGYLVHHRFWHIGLATEAAIAVRDQAFSARGFERVISLIRPENVASRRVAERVGMRVVAKTKRAELTHLVYGVRRDDLARDNL